MSKSRPDIKQHIADVLEGTETLLERLNSSVPKLTLEEARALAALQYKFKEANGLIETSKLVSWDRQKKYTFEKLNAIISFVPTIIGIVLIVLAAIWSEKQRQKTAAATSVASYNSSVAGYNNSWINDIAHMLDTSYLSGAKNYQHASPDSARFRQFYLNFQLEKKAHDSIRTVMAVRFAELNYLDSL